MIGRPEPAPHLLGRIHDRVHLPIEPRFKRRQRVADRGRLDGSDHQDVHVTRRSCRPRSDRPEQVGSIDGGGERAESRPDRLGQPHGPHHHGMQWLEDRTNPIRAIVHLISANLTFKQPRRRQGPDFPLHGAGTCPCYSRQLPQVDSTVGIGKEDTQNGAPRGAEQDHPDGVFWE